MILLYENISIMIFTILSEFNQITYPKTTNVLCYNCCHKFTTQPISMPFLFNKNMFYVKYVFCSWECMKRFNIDSNTSNMHMRSTLIQKFYHYVTLKTDTILISPPKCMLKDFGGQMSIKEFRNSNKKISYNTFEYPVIVDNVNVEKVDNFSWIKEDSAKDSYQNHIVKPKVSDTQILKRPTKTQKSSLENAMGLLRV